MDPHAMIQLAKRTAVGGVSPGSCEAEGEGSESFYIARRGRRADLRVSRGKVGGTNDFV